MSFTEHPPTSGAAIPMHHSGPISDTFVNSLSRLAGETPKLNEDGVEQSVEGILSLAKVGAWRAILTLVQRLQILHHSPPPHLLLTFQFSKLVAYCKLSMIKEANQMIDEIGPLNSSKFLFESHPTLYPGKKGSMVPFFLNLLHAQMPAYNGNINQAIERLFELKRVCVENLEKKLPGESELSLFALSLEQALHTPAASWRERHTFITLAIASLFLKTGKGPVCLELLHDLTTEAPTPALHSALARAALHFGYLDRAESYVVEMEQCIEKLRKARERSGITLVDIGPTREEEEEEEEVDSQNELLLVKGLLSFGRHNYAAAESLFRTILQNDPAHPAALANYVLALVYQGRLVQAVNFAERSLLASPDRALTPSLARTLDQIYDLVVADPGPRKDALAAFVQASYSDSFLISP